MIKRGIRITKHLGRTPAEAVCTACQKIFKAPLTQLHTVAGATTSIQEQFDRHKCGSQETGSRETGSRETGSQETKSRNES
jgi:hypothetical protein